jgi:hypothetical protein
LYRAWERLEEREIATDDSSTARVPLDSEQL